MKRPTQEQIKQWKEKYEKIYQLPSEQGKSSIIRQPDRKALSHATAVTGNDPMKFNEMILNDCWLWETRKYVRIYKFLGISEKLGEIIKKAEVELKEL